MSKRLNTDDSVKRRLDDFSVAPPPHVWNNIQTQMDARRKKRRIVYISWISGAAVVVLAFIAGWYFNAKTNDEQPVLAEQQITSDTNNTIEQTIQQETKTEAEDDIPVTENEILFAELKDEASTTKALSKENSFVLPVSGEYDEAISNSDRKIEVEGRQNYSLLKQIGAIISVEKLNLTLAEIDQPKQQNEILLADGALIAQNLKNLKEQKANERGWIVGASVSPGYSSHAANHNDTYARNMSYDSNNGGANVGAGVSVQYKTSKRLRVESGIYYAKDGQKSNNSFSMFGFKNDLEYSAAPDASYDGSAPAFSNFVRTGSNGIAMNSTAGVINMKTPPSGANITASLESATGDAVANVLYAEGEFSQVFEFVEVPLYLRYSLLDKKFGIEVLGGVNAGFVIGNNAYLDNDYGVQNIGSTADISTLNFSGTLGVGVNYALGKHFSFALEPRLNYYLNSINSNPDVDYRPYRIGVYTGVYYEF